MLSTCSQLPSARPEHACRSVVIDTETTGLVPETDEILELSIISADPDTSGEILYSGLLRPLHTESWPDAQQINGISTDMTAGAPSIREELPVIDGILAHVKTIICYNAGFDLSFLRNSGVSVPANVTVTDVMLDFAPVYGEYCEYTGNYRWKSLAVCAAYYGYDWGDDAPHGSLADCRATLHCWKQMQMHDDA